MSMTHKPKLVYELLTFLIFDHLPVFVLIPRKTNHSKIKRTMRKRQFTQQNLDKFKYELQTYDWSNLVSIPDVNSMYTAFIEMYKVGLVNKSLFKI